ncbi:hypothetical protein H0H93_008718, partial [Arthromyces matolae]
PSTSGRPVRKVRFLDEVPTQQRKSYHSTHRSEDMEPLLPAQVQDTSSPDLRPYITTIESRETLSEKSAWSRCVKSILCLGCIESSSVLLASEPSGPKTGTYETSRRPSEWENSPVSIQDELPPLWKSAAMDFESRDLDHHSPISATPSTSYQHDRDQGAFDSPKLAIMRLLKNVSNKSIEDWVQEAYEQGGIPQNRVFRQLAIHFRIMEWRRYSSRRTSAFQLSRGHEFLVVQLKGRGFHELGRAVFIRFDRYMKDMRITCAKEGSNFRPLSWQRWTPDDRVTILDDWPDERMYQRRESQLFRMRNDRLSLQDLFISAELASEAPWTAFTSRHDHWFAVLLGRILNGKMERTYVVEQPVAFNVLAKYGDWKRTGKVWRETASRRHERRKIVELIHLCCVMRYQEKQRQIDIVKTF